MIRKKTKIQDNDKILDRQQDTARQDSHKTRQENHKTRLENHKTRQNIRKMFTRHDKDKESKTRRTTSLTRQNKTRHHTTSQHNIIQQDKQR